MTAFDLFNVLKARKEAGYLAGQPDDLGTVYVTRGGYTARRPIEAAAEMLRHGAHISDFGEISATRGFGGLEDLHAHAD
jgi:hypothetical protein